MGAPLAEMTRQVISALTTGKLFGFFSKKFPRKTPLELSKEPSSTLGGTTTVTTVAAVVVTFVDSERVGTGASAGTIKKTRDAPRKKTSKQAPIVFIAVVDLNCRPSPPLAQFALAACAGTTLRGLGRLPTRSRVAIVPQKHYALEKLNK